MTIGESYRPLREVVAEELRSMILRGDLGPGERLLEDRLAEQLGVSRNPIREAIRSLEATGLVEVVPRRGAYVCRPDLDEVRQMLEVRGVLESYAASLVARQSPDGILAHLQRLITDGTKAHEAANHVRAAEFHRQFHEAIEAATGNPYLKQVIEPLRERTELVFSLLLENRGAGGWHEHERILEAIASGDGDTASTAVYEHIMSVLEDLEARRQAASTAAGGA